MNVIDSLKDIGKYLANEVQGIDLTNLQKRFDAHLEQIKQAKDELVPKIKDVWIRTAECLVKLQTEKDPDKQLILQRQFGSLKRAHINYLKAAEEKIAWEAAEQIWEALMFAKDLLVAFIRKVPI